MSLKEKLKNKLSGNQTEQVQVSDRTTVVKPEDITEEKRKMLEDFYEFREGYISPLAEAVANHFANTRNVSLDVKIDNFIEKMDTVSVGEMLRTTHNNCVTKYTPEETALHQRIVNALASQVDQEEVRKEKVKQLRLQRRLEKSRNDSKVSD